MDGQTEAEDLDTKVTSPADSEPEAAAEAKTPTAAEKKAVEPTAHSAESPQKAKGSIVLQNVERLKQEQAELRLQRKKINAELRNATKTKARLKKRARLLSNSDLLEVLQLRQQEKEAKESPAPAAGEPTAADKVTNAQSTAASSGDKSSPLKQKPIEDRFDQ